MNIRATSGLHIKARIASWLNSGAVPVIIPSTAGPVVIAVYSNGRYVEPETINIPSTLPAHWGPDGPVQMGPQEPPQEETQEGEEGED